MKRYSIGIIVVILLIGICGLALFNRLTKNNITPNNEIEQNIEYTPQVDIDKSQTSYQENIGVEELKEEVQAKGDTEIYEVTEEYDGRKVLTVKPNVQFSVVLNGIIDNKKPQDSIENLQQKAGESFQNKSGIWISNNSRQKFLNLLNKTANAKYSINDDGYLKCDDKSKQNDIDKKIANILSSKDLYIITITGSCYTVDEITGEIIEYPFEKMDPYQPNEMYKNENQKIYILTTNEKGILSNEEIVNSIFEN